MNDDELPAHFDGPSDATWPDRLEELESETPTPRTAELRRLADAARRVLHGLAMTDVDEATMRDAADRLQTVAELFERPGRTSIYEGFAESAVSGDPRGFFDHSPMLGRANPLAPPITLRRSGPESIAGLATFGAAYEGPPGCVHGGFVAAGFDEVLGATQSISGQPGMTAKLTIHYRSPTPLHEELRFEGTLVGVEGRKIFTTGTLHVGDRLCAEADGLFVSIDFSRFAALRRAREEQRSARPPHRR